MNGGGEGGGGGGGGGASQMISSIDSPVPPGSAPGNHMHPALSHHQQNLF